MVRWIALIILVSSCSSADDFSGQPTGPTIRVRIHSVQDSVTVSGFQLVLQDHRRKSISVADSSKYSKTESYQITCAPDQIKVQGNGQIILLPKVLRVQSETGSLRMGQIPYRKTLAVYPNPKKTGCEVVNELGVEEYLEGLVNAEFSAKWNPDSVKAQIVAARSYALFQIQVQKKNPNSHFDVESTIRDQVYGGMLKEDALASRYVQETKGLVLTSGKVIKAFYHSTCGGLTELPESVWGDPATGYKTRVKCESCQSSPRYQWNLKLGIKEIENKIRSGIESEGLPKAWENSDLKNASLVSIESSKWSAKNSFLRLQDLVTRWKKGSKFVELPLSAQTFRMWLGSEKIRSTAFRARLINGVAFFEGRGNGHGVGMCQWGAKVMGEKGNTMTGILSHYYPEASIKKFW